MIEKSKNKYINILIEYIVPVKVGNKKLYVVKSHKGKRLSKPSSKKAALNRLREIEFFKNKKGG
jgi:hypothetical protein